MTEKKSPLVLLPGLLCSEVLWRSQIAALADIADPVVADLSRDDSLPDMAARVLAAAPDRFALAGLSMGGYLAQEIMRVAPERVSRLALLDTSARADDPGRTAEREALLYEARASGFEGVISKLLPHLIHPDRLAADPALCAAVLGMARDIGPEVFLRQMAAIISRPDSRPGLSEIACPTLVLCGAQDARTPPAAHEEIASLIPGAKLVVVPECGHLSTMEQPEAVNASLRAWLTG